MNTKRLTCLLLVGTLLLAMPVASQATERGGVGGFLVGCCFGVRTAAAYNEGKDLHFRDWAVIIPYAGVIFSIWNAVDGAQGITTAQLRQQYGATYF